MDLSDDILESSHKKFSNGISWVYVTPSSNRYIIKNAVMAYQPDSMICT